MTLETDCIEEIKELINTILIDTDHEHDRETDHALGMRATAVQVEWIIKDYKKKKKLYETKNKTRYAIKLQAYENRRKTQK